MSRTDKRRREAAARKEKTQASQKMQTPAPEKQGLNLVLRKVPSLLDAMVNGNEYGSIVGLVPEDGADFTKELRLATAEIEKIRGRPCLCYAANLLKRLQNTGIEAADHLPFNEMVSQAASANGVDIFLVTPGGSAEQVNLFVEALRQRFDRVEFIIPYKAMSAGTLWALAGDAIWMDSRAFLGPLDPQVPSSDGTFGPAQALLTLLAHIQREGDARLQKKQEPDWTHKMLLRTLDQQKLGHALSASQYVIDMAASYLERYKFRTWTTGKTSGRTISDGDRQKRAKEVATELCSHDRWKAHGHAISRKVLTDELKIHVDHIEATPGLERAVRRAWALWYYTFDKTPVAKGILSSTYRYFRLSKQEG